MGDILCSTLWNNKLVVGGTFTSIGGGQFNRIALWDGTAWRLVGPFSGMNGEVRALKVDWNGDLIAGGTFTSAGGVSANRLARFNGVNWSAIGTGITSAAGEVNAIERVSFQGTEALYIGGTFADAGGIAGVNNIVRIDTGNAYSFVGTANFHGVEGSVYALRYDFHLWVGGTFAGVRLSSGILTSPRIAIFSLFTGAWSNAPFLGGTGVYAISSGTVNNLAQIIVGGDLQTDNFGTMPHVASTLASGAASSWQPVGSLNNTVRGMQFPFAVGDFTASSSVSSLPHIARWNNSSNRWEPLGLGVDGRANCVTAVEGAAYVAGAFDNAGGTSAPRVAQWDGQSLSRLRPRPSGPVNALYPLGSTLYVGGDFEQSTGVGDSAHNVVAISAGGYSKLDTLTGFNGTNGPVNALVYQNRGVQIGNIVAGGAFTQAGGATASNYSAYRTSTWTSALTFDGPINAVINYGCNVSGCGIVSTGGFSSVSGVPASNIARNNTALGTGLNGFGRALAVYGGNLIVGGDFTAAGGVTALHLAQWNGTSWSAFNGADLNGSVYAMTLWNSQLVIAGNFTQINGQTFNGVARWDGTAWQAFGNGLISSSFYTVRALAVHNGDLYAGGTALVDVKRWTGSAWQLVDGSFTGTVNALASFDGNLWAGGTFTTVGGRSIRYLAASRTPGTNPACPGDVNNSNGLDVQDIFDFLALWFDGNCLADFNRSGSVSVQDVFDFLAAWFAGCP